MKDGSSFIGKVFTRKFFKVKGYGKFGHGVSSEQIMKIHGFRSLPEKESRRYLLNVGNSFLEENRQPKFLPDPSSLTICPRCSTHDANSPFFSFKESFGVIFPTLADSLIAPFIAFHCLVPVITSTTVLRFRCFGRIPRMLDAAITNLGRMPRLLLPCRAAIWIP